MAIQAQVSIQAFVSAKVGDVPFYDFNTVNGMLLTNPLYPYSNPLQRT